MEKRELLKTIVTALNDKLAGNIRIIDIHEISSMGDYFVIADGKNHNQVQAICDSVEEYMNKTSVSLKNREGSANGGWILLDYYDIIVHIFSEEERSFYDLEHIWRDGIIVPVEDL